MNLRLNKNYAPVDSDYDPLDDKSLEEDLIYATNLNDLDKVKSLIELGADIHYKSDLPLRMACYWHCLEIAKFLLDHGANLYADDGWALKYAERNGLKDLVKLLKEYM